MDTVGRHVTLTVWMLVLLAAIAFVAAARGPISDSAWREPCATLKAGGAIHGHWNTTHKCDQPSTGGHHAQH